MDETRECPNCGALNRADAPWCARCLTRFETSEPSFEETYETESPRRGAGLRIVALVLMIAIAGAFGVANLISALEGPPAVRRGLIDPQGFRFLGIDPDSGEPIRYDPCSPLHYVFNEEHAPSGALADVKRSAQLTAEASGIEFVYDGTTEEPASPRRAAYQPDRYGQRWAPILIGWIPHDSAIFEHDSVGVGGSEARENDRDQLVYVTGDIILNGADQLANGFGAGRTWGKVLLHEWGHVLGLDHVVDPAQVMNANLVSSPANWGTGDRAGLRKLGSLGGCINEPPPRV